MTPDRRSRPAMECFMFLFGFIGDRLVLFFYYFDGLIRR